MDKKEKDTIRGALARGYCTDRNGKKILDPDLVEDMAVEIEKFLPNKEEIRQICQKCFSEWEPTAHIEEGWGLYKRFGKAIAERLK